MDEEGERENKEDINNCNEKDSSVSFLLLFEFCFELHNGLCDQLYKQMFKESEDPAAKRRKEKLYAG